MLVWFVLACSGDDISVDPPKDTDDVVDTDDTDPVDTDDTDPTGPTGGTGDTSATGDTGTPGLVVDCAKLPTAPLGTTLLAGPTAYHGLAFDDAGFLYGSSSNAVVQFDYYGGFTVVAPNIFGMEQFDWSPTTGMLYVISNSEVVEVDTATGGRQVVGTGLGNLYGLRVGPDDKIYAANISEIWRIDLVAGTQEIFVPSGVGRSPKVMDWSPDLSKMYFGNISGGQVFSVDLDASFDAIGPPVVFASGVGGYHDGMDVDVCGNVYVADFNTSSMFRISPSGAVNVLFDPPLANYGHGIQFGSGVGGWLEDAIYVPQPYNNDTVSEILVGVPRRTFTGKVINAP